MTAIELAARLLEVDVRALILDMDGVIRIWETSVQESIETAHGLPLGRLEEIAHQVPEYQLGVIGRCTFSDWIRAARLAAKTEFGAPGADAVDEWASYRGSTDPAMLALVGDVKRWLPVFVLSNAHDCFPDDMNRLGLSSRFDGMFHSAAMGVAKPDIAIFDRVLADIGISANQAVFVDDRAENVAAAQSAGMRAVQFGGVHRLISDVRACL